MLRVPHCPGRRNRQYSGPMRTPASLAVLAAMLVAGCSTLPPSAVYVDAVAASSAAEKKAYFLYSPESERTRAFLRAATSRVLYERGDYDGALREARYALDLDPGSNEASLIVDLLEHKAD